MSKNKTTRFFHCTRINLILCFLSGVAAGVGVMVKGLANVYIAFGIAATLFMLNMAFFGFTETYTDESKDCEQEPEDPALLWWDSLTITQRLDFANILGEDAETMSKYSIRSVYNMFLDYQFNNSFKRYF